jgi:ABC-2 type transport system ATP-binding protein
VPQELALYSRLSSRENLESFGRYHGLAGDTLRQAVKWCLTWAALLDRAGEPVKNLSGGMKRRLNMAAGLVHQPKLILMDEPTVGVDPQSRNRIFEMIEELHGEGTSMIYTTHYMEEAERLCDSNRHHRSRACHRVGYQGRACPEYIRLAQSGAGAFRGSG